MGHTRITRQGQTSVPATVRRLYGLGPGSELAWEVLDGRLTLTVVGYSLADFARLLPAPPTQPVSLEEMDRAIGEGAGEDGHGSR